MEEFNPTIIARRSVRGVFTFVSRTLVMQGVGFVAFILYGVVFSREEMGIYFLVSAAVDFLAYFSDIGLAGSLIQKKDAITKDDIATTFTIQQMLVITVVGIALVCSKIVGNFYHLDQKGLLLFQALVIAFFISSLKTIPSILLERSLRFEKLVIPELVETIFFYPVVLFFAVKGFGITSFTIAVITRAIAGLVTIYIIAPWHMRFAFSKNAARQLLSFGIPFQLNSFIALLKDDLLLLYLGKILPITYIGYIGFAQKWAFIPLRIVMDNVTKVTFSSFARLQHDTKALGKSFEKALFAETTLIFPSLVGMVILSSYIVHIIPKYQKWEPALFSLLFFGINALLASFLVPATNLLSAIGKIKVTLYFMIGMTIAIWLATPFFVLLYGFNGAAIASAAVNLFAIPAVITLKKYVTFHTISAIWLPTVGTFCMGLFLYVVSPFFVKDFSTLICIIVAGIAVYCITLFLFGKKAILSDIKFIKENIRK